jgi:glycosyltransferase involved in cell wall biosynthesis
MKTTIIMPAYNAQKYIGETFESVIAQTAPDWELVVIDDGSTDDTAQVVRAYSAREPRIRLIQQANARTAVARNHGFAAADPKSEYIAYLDSDDLWEKDTLETFTQALERNPKHGAAHGLLRFIDGQSRSLSVPYYKQQLGITRHEIKGGRVVPIPRNRPTTFSSLLISSFVTPGQVILRRSIVEKVGKWDPKFLIVDDYDMWLRIAEHTDFVHIEKEVIAYRIHDNNWSRRPLPLWTEFVALMLKTLASPDTSDAHRCDIAVGSVFHFTGMMADRNTEEGRVPFDVLIKHSHRFAEELLRLACSRDSSEELRRLSLSSIYAMHERLSKLVYATDISDEQRRVVIDSAATLKGMLAEVA